MKWKQTLKKLLREKGYYLAFAVCLAAVLVSGWLFVRSLGSTDDELAAPDAIQAVHLPTGKESLGQEKSNSELPVKPIHPAAPVIPESEAPAETDAAPTAPQRPGAVSCRPVDGTLLQAYSMDKLAYNATTRDWRTHAGMDIAAPEGSPVVAVAEGTVLSVFEDELLGQTVAVEHAGGYVTHYANLSPEVAVSAGDRVTPGQTLGTVGKTALGEVSSEAHLHFAVYKNNVPQDPESFLEG